MPIVCPIDSKDDAIQKVSALVSAGKSTGSFSGPSGGLTRTGEGWGSTVGYTTLRGGTITDLAKMLTPPRKPKQSIYLAISLFILTRRATLLI